MKWSTINDKIGSIIHILSKMTDFSALMLAQYFSENSELYFQLLNGDKDLLRFAHKALKKPYYMARFPTAGGAIFETRFCGFAFVRFPSRLPPCLLALG